MKTSGPRAPRCAPPAPARSRSAGGGNAEESRKPSLARPAPHFRRPAPPRFSPIGRTLTAPRPRASPPTVPLTFHLLTFWGSGSPRPRPPGRRGGGARESCAVTHNYWVAPSVHQRGSGSGMAGDTRLGGEGDTGLREWPGPRGGEPEASAHARCVRSADGGDDSHGGSVREAGAARRPGFGAVSQVRGARLPVTQERRGPQGGSSSGGALRRVGPGAGVVGTSEPPPPRRLPLGRGLRRPPARVAAPRTPLAPRRPAALQGQVARGGRGGRSGSFPCAAEARRPVPSCLPREVCGGASAPWAGGAHPRGRDTRRGVRRGNPEGRDRPGAWGRGFYFWPRNSWFCYLS